MIKKISIISSILFLLTACSTNKEITQIRSTGISSYTAGDYQSSLEKFEELISNAEEKGGLAGLDDYERAGISAHALALNDKAEKYLEQARLMNSTNENVYFALADIYHLFDNISKEVRFLEYYQKNHPKGDKIELVRLRLFEAYVKSESWEQGLALWPLVKETDQYQEVLLGGYLKIVIALENESEADKAAKDLLKIDENNVLALKWTAERYFWKAENYYQSEMAAYNKKKTNSQYAKLLKALDIVTDDFKRSRDLFERLYKISPDERYAGFLSNIYARLDDKEKARYYRSRSGQ